MSYFKSKIEKTLNNKKGIVFYNSFPNNKCAELEILFRIKIECERLGYVYIMIDNNNKIIEPFILKGVYINSVNPNYLLFGLSLHFVTANKLHIPCVLALFNPINYFIKNSTYISNINSYNYYTSASSNKDQFIVSDKSKFIGMLHTTLSGPILNINNSGDKIFYCGINWDKTHNTKGRYHDILTKLDNNNMIKIYGPKFVDGQNVWNGFKNYIDEIPFDGQSIIHYINACGIGLVLTSIEHVNDELVSNRLFECICAGVPIIANHNNFIKKWFSDNVFYIDIINSEIAYNQIVENVDFIKKNRHVVLGKILKCREIFQKHFTLGRQFTNLVNFFLIRNGYKNLHHII
jgi:hypothetical protein